MAAGGAFRPGEGQADDLVASDCLQPVYGSVPAWGSLGGVERRPGKSCGRNPSFLQENEAAFDILVSTDTLIYIGGLHSVFETAYTALRENGLFAFSLEKAGDTAVEDYFLTPVGRYVHNQDYVRKLLDESGFTVLSMQEATIRSEGNDPVSGILVIASR